MSHEHHCTLDGVAKIGLGWGGMSLGQEDFLPSGGERAGKSGSLGVTSVSASFCHEGCQT